MGDEIRDMRVISKMVMEKASRMDVNRILGDVQTGMCFWVNNGPILHNLEDLSAALKVMDLKTFRHHVNKDKNDFAVWIDEVIGDKILAKSLSKIKTRKTTLKKVNDRIRSLKKLKR